MSSHLASLEISSTAANQAAVAKKFVCEYPACGKAFATSGHLSRHAKAHSGLKPYSCPIPNCTSKFSRHDNMLQHYRSHAKKIWCSSIPANAPPLRRRPYTKRANPDQQQQQQQQQATRPEAISLPRGQSPPNSVSPTASVHHHSLSRPYPEHGPAEAYAFPNHGYYSPPSPSIRLTDDSVDRRASFSPSASHSHFVRYPHPHPHSVEAASHSRYNHDFPTKLRELSAPALPSVSSVSSPSSERLPSFRELEQSLHRTQERPSYGLARVSPPHNEAFFDTPLTPAPQQYDLSHKHWDQKPVDPIHPRTRPTHDEAAMAQGYYRAPSVYPPTHDGRVYY